MSFYNKPVFFYAYSNVLQTASVGQYFGLTHYSNVGAGTTAGTIDIPIKGYVYGELQTNVASSNNNYDVKMPNNTLSLCEGFQCRNNNTVGGMDDGAYGQIESAETGVYFQQRFSTGSERSDADQTRIYGVYLS